MMQPVAVEVNRLQMENRRGLVRAEFYRRSAFRIRTSRCTTTGWFANSRPTSQRSRCARARQAARAGVGVTPADGARDGQHSSRQSHQRGRRGSSQPVVRKKSARAKFARNRICESIR